jgi:signal peptidase
MNRLLRASRVCVTAALTITIIALVAVNLLPRTGQVRIAHELTGSMAPTIPVGGLLVYRPLSAAELKPRDVISFRRTGYSDTITHRVVSVSRPGGSVDVVTRGDANYGDDPVTTFAPGETVWRVALVLPVWVGTIVSALVTHGTLFVLCLLPLEFLLPWIVRQLAEPPASVSSPSPEPARPL